jgi:hypothetical protein
MTQGYCGAAFMMLAVTGRLNATLEPGQGPFSTIHITDMDLELTEQIDLSYRWFLLGDGWQALNSRVAHCGASEKQAGNLLKSRCFLDFLLDTLCRIW